MQILKQSDPRWGKVKIGKSDATLARWGCTITSLSMLSDWYGLWRSPDWIAKNLEFTADGRIIWRSMDGRLPMEFIWRYYSRDDETLKRTLASKDNAAIIEVNRNHWVVLIGYSRIYGFKIADPLYGDTVWLNKRYKNITGFTVVTRL